MPSKQTGSGRKKLEEASTNGEGASDHPQPGPRSSSVFDFLYHDSRRVASFLSQFEAYGALQQTKATEIAGRTVANRTSAAGAVELLTVAKANAALDITTTDDERDLAEHSYDPLWKNARTLLDYLEEHDAMERDVSKARLGQFVLAKGGLILLDLSMLKSSYEKPSIKQQLTAGVQLGETGKTRAERRRNKTTSPQANDGQFVLDMLSMLPHSIQIRMHSEDRIIWASLNENSLVGTSSDLF